MADLFFIQFFLITLYELNLLSIIIGYSDWDLYKKVLLLLVAALIFTPLPSALASVELAEFNNIVLSLTLKVCIVAVVISINLAKTLKNLLILENLLDYKIHL